MDRMRDLEEVISLARQAVDGVPEGHPRLTGYLNSLSRMLRKRYKRTGLRRSDSQSGTGGRYDA
jgi:hypothetical protein